MKTATIVLLVLLAGCATTPCPLGLEGTQCRVERHADCMIVHGNAMMCRGELKEKKGDGHAD